MGQLVEGRSVFDIESYLNAPLILDEIEGEIKPPLSLRCFLGAWYHKAVSSKDNWLGMEAVVTLPEFIPDETRYEMINHEYLENAKIKRYLDTPSVYMGGSSDDETDIGFAWFYGLVDGELKDEKFTFRPFWRTIYKEYGVTKNVYSGTKITETEYYYYPGDTVKIHLFCPEIDFLQLRVELIEETKIEKYSKIREKMKSQGVISKVLLTDKIIAPGNGQRPSEYKRVNAIDQYYNEGKPSHDSKAEVLPCKWSNVNLFRINEGVLVKVPFNEERITRALCPDPRAFTIDKGDGYESIIINPKSINGLNKN